MFNRSVYIERATVLASCGLAPALASLWTWQTTISRSEALILLLAGVVLFGLLGAITGALIHRRLAVGNIPWGGHQETAALIKQAIGELIANSADEKLNQAAIHQANAQEGRATALYLTARINQLRHQDAQTGGAANPIAIGRRVFWIVLCFVLAVGGSLTPAFAPDFSQQNLALIALALLAPIWITGLAISGLGMKNAHRWLPLPGRRNKAPKIKARKSATTAGSWHTKQNQSNIPLFRLILLFPVVVAAALYLLREFGPQPKPQGYEELSFEAEPEASAVVRAPTPVPTQRVRPAPTPPIKREQRAQARQSTQSAADNWDRIPANGSVLRGNTKALNYAGWALNDIKAALDESRQRMDQWYVSFLRDNPDATGRISLRLILQPEGYVSRIDVVASEIGHPQFINALRDRLEASALPVGAMDSASVVYSMDFRP